MNDPKKLRFDEVLPGGKGTFSVSSDESQVEIAHRLAEDAKEREDSRKHDGLDKNQERRHAEMDYWTVRLVMIAAVGVAAWILNTHSSNEPAVRFAWGLIGSVIGAAIGLLKSKSGNRS